MEYDKILSLVITKRGTYLQYHAIKQLPFQLEQELLKRFQLLFRNGKFPRIVVH